MKKKEAIYPCELLKCRSEKPGTVNVNEIIGDASFRVMICEDCAKRLGLKNDDDIQSMGE